VQRDKEKAKTIQVGFLAINKKGQVGAYAIQKGFVYSIKTNTENKVVAAKHIL
jgi:N4-(beta-N-acetylglucosaminyl)-L-asparaginase